jgi:hypothetical protein
MDKITLRKQLEYAALMDTVAEQWQRSLLDVLQKMNSSDIYQMAAAYNLYTTAEIARNNSIYANNNYVINNKRNK